MNHMDVLPPELIHHVYFFVHKKLLEDAHLIRMDEKKRFASVFYMSSVTEKNCNEYEMFNMWLKTMDELKLMQHMHNYKEDSILSVIRKFNFINRHPP